MMEGNVQEELELEKSVRRFREKFHGKVALETAVVLMRRFANNHNQVCTYVILYMDNDTDLDVRNHLRNDQVAMNVINKIKRDDQRAKEMPKDKDIQDLAKKMNTLPLTQKNLKMFNDAAENRIPARDRQFACKECDYMWWRRVPQRKEVSRCQRCRKKFDPVPDNKMWGIGEYNCQSCKRMFRGYGQIEVSSPCYMCSKPVSPSCILPPRRNQGPRTRNTHSCFAEYCYNRKEPFVPGLQCAHPKSRILNQLPKVLHPSEWHISTGSTIATCLSQGSLNENDIDDIILDDIKEEEDDEETDDSDS
ncbi:shiftless antiviral inhibitor of ribosomal frameshifting protein homolog [Xenopus laevis]|uniref:Shiftless antiviral inhibitor of ribosomal frameshifting protein homolog n=3 Tax=Xenopus laevis TaxID=8355 RepID=SHFL_XENLA|nr:shiftless antiviral inhibitor of ribosomal frameshifting protein homolog [Xenopus laevis]Q6GMD3.1 RecName: Full=Shiftless antiviral inhibitor of ribosomal frameshifting protein homolog; Short=SHFL; AltName: Full=Repressor of yield of DENV protein homolog [Xenopus laevis]AAH74135.1 MGC81857 protein [Xenopus laevis]OCT90378.1 hypothetical protein XELAEV_18018991mg [Xenopus laevis]